MNDTKEKQSLSFEIFCMIFGVVCIIGAIVAGVLFLAREDALSKTYDDAVTKFNNFDYAGAVQESDIYISSTKDPKNLAGAYNLRGQAEAKLGNTAQAVEDYEKALSYNPNLKSADSNLGDDSSGDLNARISYYEAAIALDPKDEQSPSNEHLLLREANAYEDAGDEQKVAETYARIEAIDPNNATLYLNEGLAYANLAQWQNALNSLQKSVAIKTDNDAYVVISQSEYNLGMQKNACDDLKRVSQPPQEQTFITTYQMMLDNCNQRTYVIPAQ